MCKSLDQGFILGFVYFSFIFQGSGGLRNVQLEAERYIRRGQEVQLQCNYELGADSLYAVKMYRGSEEFYRFLPKESPPKQAFPFPGLSVNLEKSDEHRVHLRNTSFETGGTFRCVISVEGTFQTLDNARELDVVVIDYNSPKLYLDKMGYQPGDRGLANCVIEKTFPVPNITWFINGKEVNNISVLTRVEPVNENKTKSRNMTTPSSVTTTTDSLEKNIYRVTGAGRGRKNGRSSGSSAQLTSSLSTLTFPIQSYSPLTIKCRGELYSVYNETSTILIQPKAPLHYPYSTTTRIPKRESVAVPGQLNLNATTLNHAPTNYPQGTILIFVSIILFW